MGLRFYRRVKILPGVHLNFSKSGVSTSIGVRGAHITYGPRGKRVTIGLPGTGISYTETEKKSIPQQAQTIYNSKGYILKEVVVCPCCNNMFFYETIMNGKKLHCKECGHYFTLENNIKKVWVPPFVKCEKCGTIFEKARASCPKCGEQNQQASNTGCLTCIALIFIACISFII